MQTMATSAAPRPRSRCRSVAIAAALGMAACNQASDVPSRPTKAKEASMVYPVRSVWAGASQIRESATIVTSASGWEALRASWEAVIRAKVGDPAVAWDRELVLILAGRETADHTVSVTVSRLERAGDHVAIDVTSESEDVAVWIPHHPTLVAVAPQAAFAGTPTLRLQWNGQPWPVAVTREP